MRQRSETGLVICAPHNKLILSTAVLTPSGVSSLTYFSRALQRGFFLTVFCDRELNDILYQPIYLVFRLVKLRRLLNVHFIHIQRPIDFNL